MARLAEISGRFCAQSCEAQVGVHEFLICGGGPRTSSAQRSSWVRCVGGLGGPGPLLLAMGSAYGSRSWAGFVFQCTLVACARSGSVSIRLQASGAGAHGFPSTFIIRFLFSPLFSSRGGHFVLGFAALSSSSIGQTCCQNTRSFDAHFIAHFAITVSPWRLALERKFSARRDFFRKCP